MNVNLKSTVIIVFSLTIGLIGFSNGQQVLVHDLGGDDWLAYNQERSINTLSIVPGSIYSDLIKGGVLKGGDVYQEYNDIAYRWVAYDNWTFVKKFDVNENLLTNGKIFLTCHGLDTIGNVSLNGNVLGQVDNMFVRYKWPIKDILKQNQNEIKISFESPSAYAKRLFLQKSYPIPPASLALRRNPEFFVQFVRKMQASFSWDWAPAIPTQGIWRPIEIEAYNDVLLRSISVDTKPTDSNYKQWALNTTVWMESISSDSLKGNISLYLDNKPLIEEPFYLKSSVRGEYSFSLQRNTKDAGIQILPWFPNGVSGGNQVLYNLTATITTKHQSITKTIKIGFRTVELVQEKLSTKDESYSFYFKVNGQPIYSKGSNWMPAHLLQESVTEDYIESLLMSAKLANMNMIRVWGGGVYETDWFYELCDKFGILVWQDMMFVRAAYPADSKFLSSVTDEISQQIRRLQHHPSIAIWSGNSNCEEKMASGHWTELPQYKSELTKDYIDLFIKTIIPTIANEDQTRPIVTSSTSSGVLDPNHNYLTNMTKQYGDFHSYIADGNTWDWKRYPSAKFISEYGFWSMLSSNTLQKYVHHQYFQLPFMEPLKHRQISDDYENKIIVKLIEENLPIPEQGGANRFDDFVYLTQVFQAMSTKIETEFYRRNRNVTENGEGFTLGALNFALNDVWPGYSMSSLEFGGKWKIVQNYLANSFDNYLVVIYEDGEYAKVMIVRDDHLQEDIHFDVQVEIFDWSNQRSLNSINFRTVTKPFSANLVYQTKTSELLANAKCQDRNHCFMQVTIESKSASIDITRTNFLLLDRIKNAVGLERPNIRIRGSMVGPFVDELGFIEYRFDLENDRIAPFVYLDLAHGSNINGIFSDNGFILIDHMEISFKTRDKVSANDLKQSILIKSLKDVNH